MNDRAQLRSRLERRYAEPHRRYHDLRHLHEVLSTVDELAGEAEEIEVVRWAAWYHDAVYDVRRDDNEERSAQLAERELTTLGLRRHTVQEVARLVRVTATHDPAPDDANGAVLCDADLRILAADADRHAEYLADVRAEYAHVPEPDFRAGRAALLRSLLSTARLFRTESGHARWEERARANITAELDALRA